MANFEPCLVILRSRNAKYPRKKKLFYGLFCIEPELESPRQGEGRLNHKLSFNWAKMLTSMGTRTRALFLGIPRSKIARNYLIAFMLIIVLPSFILNILMNRFYEKSLLKNASERTFQALEQISTGIETETGRASVLAKTVAGDKELLQLVNRWNRAADAIVKQSIADRIDARLSRLYNYSDDVYSLIFIFQNERNYYCYKNSPIFMPLALIRFDGYHQAAQNPGKVVLTGSLENFYPELNNRYVYSAWIRPATTATWNEVGMIYFAFRTQVIDKLYSNMTSPVGEIFITDEQDRIIGPHDRLLFDKNYRELNYLHDLSRGRNHSFTAVINQHKMFITSYTLSR